MGEKEFSIFFYEILHHFFIRLCGYGNAISFGAITDNHIDEVETFVRENMYDYLLRKEAEKRNESEQKVDEGDVHLSYELLVEHFGEVKALEPKTFCFQPGDKILILKMASYVKIETDLRMQNCCSKLFKFKQKEGTKVVSTNSMLAAIDAEKLKLDLIERTICCMKSYGADHFFDVDMDCVIHENTVDVHITEGSGIYGLISCAICDLETENKSKPKRVFYNCDPKFPRWIVSNFATHLKTVHKLRIQNKLETPKTIQNIGEPHIVDDDSIVIVYADEGETDAYADGDGDKQITIDIYSQLSSQINVMMPVVLSNSESREEVYFLLNKISSPLIVAKINGDGNCLFAALAHQIVKNKINSSDHQLATKNLRQRVVNHILNPNNFPRFEQALHDRVYEMKRKDEINDMATDCKLFVKHSLAQNGFWGGTETILAVSELEQVNIVIFFERGPCSMQSFRNHNRSVCIGYRLASKDKGETLRNHYDSVCDLQSAVLYNTSQALDIQRNQK